MNTSLRSLFSTPAKRFSFGSITWRRRWMSNRSECAVSSTFRNALDIVGLGELKIIRHAIDRRLNVVQLIDRRHKIVRLKLHEQRECFGVVLLLHIRFEVVRQAVIEVSLFPIFQKRRIAHQAESELKLPVIREEMLMLKLEMPAAGVTQ